MDDLIRIYGSGLDDDYCELLIDKFEKNSEKHEKIGGHRRSFTQLHMFTNDLWQEEVNKILAIFVNCLNLYVNDCKIAKIQWPDDYKWEGFRMKRYLPDDQDEFYNHVDVQNYELANRFLTFFMYLNNNEGGQTDFPMLEKHADCKQGDILLFPPMWPWVHRGKKPIDKPKYKVQSYLHYV